MDIKIIIAAHKPCAVPNDSIYLPIHVGKEQHKEVDMGFQPDNEGENISVKNPYYCELTALFWGWKNLKCNYMGLAHYRRHFSVTRPGKDKFHWIMTGEQAEMLCAMHQVILPRRRNYFIESLWKHYEHTHDVSHLEKTRVIISEMCPEFLETFDMVMKRTWSHMFNMFLMKKELADKYCKWLFPILFELEKRVDLSGLSTFDARLFGRVSELLLDVWIETNQLKYKEVGFVQMGNENWPKKINGFLAAKFLGKKYSQSK